jgi:hypothetical protein
MSGFNDGRTLNDLMNSLPNTVLLARKRDAKAELERRIKRCQELTVYLQALHFVYSNLGSIDKEEKTTCSEHVLEELRSWGHTVLLDVNTLYDLSKIIVRVQVASIQNLNTLKLGIEPDSKPT